MRALRSILAVALGFLAAGLAAAAIEGAGHWLFPPPPGIDLADPAALAKIMDQLPLGALLSVLLGWLAGTTIGAAVSAWLAPGRPFAHGLIVGMLVLACGVATMLAIQHPIWFWAATVVLSPIAAFRGAKLGVAARDRSRS